MHIMFVDILSNILIPHLPGLSPRIVTKKDLICKKYEIFSQISDFLKTKVGQSATNKQAIIKFNMWKDREFCLVSEYHQLIF